MKQLITISFVLCFYLLAKAQTNPINLPPNDPTWELNTNVSDEFNYNQYNQTQRRTAMKAKWDLMYGGGNVLDSFGNPAKTYYRHEDGRNITVDNGVCILQANNDTGTWPVPCATCWGKDYKPYYGTPVYRHYNYSGAELISLHTVKYGYFELKFRLPNNATQISKNKGIQPNFWFFDLVNGNCPKKIPGVDNPYQELDVFEINTNQHYLLCPTLHYGGEDNTGPIQNDAWKDIGWGGKSSNGNTIFEAPFNYNIDFVNGQFHTVGYEWMPEHVAIYVDGVLQRSSNWHQDEMCSMNIIIDLYAGSGFNGDPNAGTEFPFKYEVDYLRYYEFKPYVGIDYSACSPDYNMLGSNRNNKIELGNYQNNNSGCNAKLPSNRNLVLRATTEIDLYEGFETDDSSELYFDANNY